MGARRDRTAAFSVQRPVSGRLRLACAFIALAACNRSADPVEPGTSQPGAEHPAHSNAVEACTDAECLTERARDAQDAGLVDVGSRYLARAYDAEQTPERLRSWLEALEATGQDRALAAAVREHGAAHPSVVNTYAGVEAQEDGSVLPAPNDAVTKALELERRGELAAAVEALAELSHPSWLARRGMILETTGASEEAARAFAHSRIELDERGATFRLAPFDTTFSTGLAWLDGHAIRIAGWRAMEIQDQVTVTAFEHLDPGERFDVTQTLLVRTSLHTTMGERVYGISHWREQLQQLGIGIYDLRTGASLGLLEAPVGDRLPVRVLDYGDDRRYVAEIAGQDITISERGGEKLGTFSIDGTTPTITRVYTGEGSHHDNILNNDPSWPVAFAISKDAKSVAIGVSDSSVHLFDANGRTTKKLTVKWDYTERRMMGGNADHNRPAALAFDDQGALTAIFSRGDIVKWNARGRKIAHHKGGCSQADLETYSRRYGDPMPITDDDRKGCVRVHRSWLSPSGDRVATTGAFDLRVIDTKSGKTVIAFNGTGIGADSLAWAGEDSLVFSNLYGQVWQWQEGSGVVSRTETRDGMSTGPRSPRLSSDLRVLQWGGDYRPVVAWDLFSGASLNDGKLLDSVVAGSFAYRIERDGSGWVVSNATGKKVYPFDDESPERVEFLGESGRQLIARRGTKVYFVDLEKRREQALEVTTAARAGRETSSRASADGGRVAILGEDMTLRVFETAGGTLVLSRPLDIDTQQYRGDFALAPDGSWIAWQEQLERPKNGLPDVRVHVVGIDRGVRDRTVTVPGWADILAPHPDSQELLIATENTINRLDISSGQLTDEGFEYVGVNSLHYALDATLVLFERYGQVDIRANAPGLPVLASVYALDNKGWFVQTRNGAVDGSDNAPQSLATIVDGPLDATVLPGQVAWDRFAVPHLLAQPKGYEAPAPGAG